MGSFYLSMKLKIQFSSFSFQTQGPSHETGKLRLSCSLIALARGASERRHISQGASSTSDYHPSLTLAFHSCFATKANTECLENLVFHQLPSEQKILVSSHFMK